MMPSSTEIALTCGVLLHPLCIARIECNYYLPLVTQSWVAIQRLTVIHLFLTIAMCPTPRRSMLFYLAVFRLAVVRPHGSSRALQMLACSVFTLMQLEMQPIAMYM